MGKIGLFRKRALKRFKIAHGDKLFWKVSQMVLLIKISQNLQFLVFFLEKDGFFLKRDLKCFKNAKHQKNFSKGSYKTLLLKVSQNLQTMGFFLKKMGFSDKNLGMFQDR